VLQKESEWAGKLPLIGRICAGTFSGRKSINNLLHAVMCRSSGFVSVPAFAQQLGSGSVCVVVRPPRPLFSIHCTVFLLCCAPLVASVFRLDGIQIAYVGVIRRQESTLTVPWSRVVQLARKLEG